MRSILTFIAFFSFQVFALAQCNPVNDPALSNRIANYSIDLELDHIAKKVFAEESITWINSSPDTLQELRMYMYLNAFKNTQSTFIGEQGGIVFGQDISKRSAETWGWINVDNIRIRNGDDLSGNIRYIQPDDDNLEDETVLQISLNQKVYPGDTIFLDLKFTVKMPWTIARVGYSKNDFFLFVHWFPKMGVYERDQQGKWGWNCHQFHAQTEFYADFGVYDVKMKVSDHLVLGASGCLIDKAANGDGTTTHYYRAEDVIDFAWVVYPHFEVFEDQWEHVAIKLLIPPEHRMHSDRYLNTIKGSLQYLNDHVGRYPYPNITIVDPPFHALRSGLMEYPTLITCGSFYAMPTAWRSLEALAAHEFSHQYFMATIASNEKEEAWLDEGFVTYFEDLILDSLYGEKSSVFDLIGYRTGNKELSRIEYASLPNPRVGTIARPGWEFKEAYKELIYSKTATMLQTMKGMLGPDLMDKLIKTYYETWKFRHPKGRDFVQLATDVVLKEAGSQKASDIKSLLQQSLYETAVCDYAVERITNSKRYSGHGLFTKNGEKEFRKGAPMDGFYSSVVLHRKGEMVLPVEVLIRFDDGSEITELWDGSDWIKVLNYEGDHRVISAHIDPNKNIFLDVDLNNNSKTLKPSRAPIWKFAIKAVFWVQNTFHTIGWLG